MDESEISLGLRSKGGCLVKRTEEIAGEQVHHSEALR